MLQHLQQASDFKGELFISSGQIRDSGCKIDADLAQSVQQLWRGGATSQLRDDLTCIKLLFTHPLVLLLMRTVCSKRTQERTGAYKLTVGLQRTRTTGTSTCRSPQTRPCAHTVIVARLDGLKRRGLPARGCRIDEHAHELGQHPACCAFERKSPRLQSQATARARHLRTLFGNA